MTDLATIGSLRVAMSLDSAAFYEGATRAAHASGQLENALTRSAQRSVGAVSNLAAQFSDIGVMLASGQSPLLLAVQQGAQIAPILGQAGAAGAAGLLKAALASLINPTTLLTIGSIAAGAAMIQWLTGAGEKAETVEEALKRITASVDAYGDALRDAARPMADLRREYGEWADLADARLQRDMEARRRQANREAGGAVNAFAGLGSGWFQPDEDWAGISAAAKRELAGAAFGLDDDGIAGDARRARRAIITELVGAYDEVTAAADQSAGRQAEAWGRVIDAMTAAAAAVGGISEEDDALIQGASDVQSAWLEAAAAEDAVAKNRAAEADAASSRAGAEANQERVRLLREVVALEYEAANGAGETRDILGEVHARMLEASQVDLAKTFADAKSPLSDLLGMLDTGLSRLRGWGGALGDFVAGFAPDADLARSLAGMTDGVEASAALLRNREGFQPVGTWDVNAFRAGYGSDTVTLADGSIHAITEGMRVSQTDAERDLQRRIATEFMPAAIRAVGQDVFAQLSATQEAVLTSIAYNYGSIPDDIAAAVRAGSAAGVAEAIRGHGGDNGGINRDRRNQEAALFAGQELAGIGALEAASASAAQVAREQADEASEAKRIADEAAAAAKRELGFREDLISASDRAAQDAQLQAQLVGLTAGEQARLRTAYELTNQATANGIDLNERIAGSTETYGEHINAAAAAAGRAAAEQERLEKAQDAAADAAKKAADMQLQLASNLAGAALGPIRNSPIGGILDLFPGVQEGAASVFSGFLDGGLGGAASAIGNALSGLSGGLGGLGTAIGAIAGPIGIGIGLFNALKGQTEVLDAGIRVQIRDWDALVQTFEKTHTTRLWGLLNSEDTDLDPAERRVVEPIAEAYQSIREQVGRAAAALGIGADAFDHFRDRIHVSTEGMSRDEAIEAIQAKLGQVGDKLAKLAGVSAEFVREGETASQALVRMGTDLKAVNAAVETLGGNTFAVSLKGADKASRIVDQFGGLDAFAQATQAYFQGFYTLDEQAREAGQQFRKSLHQLGIGVIPESVKEFRSMVDGLLERGRTTKAAGLIALADDFQALLGLRDQLAEEGKTGGHEIDGERLGLLKELYDLQGRHAKVLALESQELEPANRKLFRRIEGLKAEQAIEDERDGLIRRHLEAIGDEVGLRRLEVQGVAAANRAYLRRVLREEDAARVEDEREGLLKQLYELQGKTNLLRQMELKALDPANRALQRHIWHLEDLRETLDALDPSLFASRLDFERAQAAVANRDGPTGAGGPLDLKAPDSREPKETKAEASLRKEVRTLKAEMRQVVQLLRGVEEHTHTSARLDRQAAAIGLLTRSA